MARLIFPVEFPVLLVVLAGRINNRRGFRFLVHLRIFPDAHLLISRAICFQTHLSLRWPASSDHGISQHFHQRFNIMSSNVMSSCNNSGANNHISSDVSHVSGLTMTAFWQGQQVALSDQIQSQQDEKQTPHPSVSAYVFSIQESRQGRSMRFILTDNKFIAQS